MCSSPLLACSLAERQNLSRNLQRCPTLTLQNVALWLRSNTLPYAYATKRCLMLTLHNVALRLRSITLPCTYAPKRCITLMLWSVALCFKTLHYAPTRCPDALCSKTILFLLSSDVWTDCLDCLERCPTLTLQNDSVASDIWHLDRIAWISTRGGNLGIRGGKPPWRLWSLISFVLNFSSISHLLWRVSSY